MTEHQLDARRLLCPIPVIRTQNRVRELSRGDRLRVLATDPGVLSDIPAWCRINGHDVLSSEEKDGRIEILLQVGEPSDALF